MNDDNQQTVPLLGSSSNYSAGVPPSGENQQHVRIVNNLATATSKVIQLSKFGFQTNCYYTSAE